MHQFTTAAIVAYSPDQLFELVTDVVQYPQFLNGCSAATVLQDMTEDCCTWSMPE